MSADQKKDILKSWRSSAVRNYGEVVVGDKTVYARVYQQPQDLKILITEGQTVNALSADLISFVKMEGDELDSVYCDQALRAFKNMLTRINKSESEAKKLDFDMDAARIPTLSNETESLIIQHCVISNFQLNLLQDMVKAQLHGLQEVQCGDNVPLR